MSTPIDILANIHFSDVLFDIVDEFQKNHTIIISSPSELNHLIYQNLNQKHQLWHSSKNCMIKGCRLPSIRNSHTIQKEGSLRVISEKGHVLVPAFDRNNHGYCIKPIGIARASTFPGFCKVHEGLFFEYEHNHRLTRKRHFQLQVFRTICRELRIKKMMLNDTQRMLKEYLLFRNTKLYQLVRNKLGESFFKQHPITIQSIEIDKIDQNEIFMKKNIHKYQKDISSFEENFYEGICDDLTSGKEHKLYTQYCRIDTKIPVALAGRGNFYFKRGHESNNIEVILMVLPFLDHSFIVMSSAYENKYAIDNYLKSFTVHPLVIITMIESWMLHGSDHWFIMPSIWHAINNDTKQNILNELLSTQHNIGNLCQFSIFNDIRKKKLTNIPADQRNTLQKTFQLFLNNEEVKLQNSIIDTLST